MYKQNFTVISSRKENIWKFNSLPTSYWGNGEKKSRERSPKSVVLNLTYAVTL